VLIKAGNKTVTSLYVYVRVCMYVYILRSITSEEIFETTEMNSKTNRDQQIQQATRNTVNKEVCACIGV
jgi:hypothetical protein